MIGEGPTNFEGRRPGPGEGQEAAVLRHASDFLRRWRDHWTRNESDDLAQETAIRFWWQASPLLRAGALRSYVRTMARRCRCRGLVRYLRERQVSLDSEEHVRRSLAPPQPAPPTLCVGGRRVRVAVLREHLAQAVAELPALNRYLVCAYYEGFSVAELSARYELSEACVKKRIHRSRGVLRKMLEDRAARPETDGTSLDRTLHEGEMR